MMIKKLLSDRASIIFPVVLLILLITGLIISLKPKPSGPMVSPVIDKMESEATSKLIFWEDPAGFKFNYPENITIDSRQEDMENYAHLELVVPDQEGSIVIWVKETGFIDIEDWLKQEDGGGQIFDTQLGGYPAKRTPKVRQLKKIFYFRDLAKIQGNHKSIFQS